MATTVLNAPISRMLLSLTIMHCAAQGIIVSLLATFLTSKRDRHPWFKVYVVCVNLLSLVQTAIHIIAALDALDLRPPQIVIVVLSPLLTAIMTASVQAFYIHRCWQIFKQRILPIIPFLLCLLTALISGSLVGFYSLGLQSKAPASSNPTKVMSMTIWAFSSFILDFSMTFTTIAFLYQSRKDFSEHKNIFNTVWQVVWASTVPPLLLMMIVIINGYIFSKGGFTPALMSGDMTGKFFLLSLMITLAGQGYVRRQFEHAHRSHVSDPSTFRMVSGAISAPSSASTTPTQYEMQPRGSLSGMRAAEVSQGSLEEDVNQSHISIIKPCEPPQAHHEVRIHNVPLSPQL